MAKVKGKLHQNHALYPQFGGVLMAAIAVVSLVLHLLDWFHLSEFAFMCLTLFGIGQILQALGIIVYALKIGVLNDE